MPLGKLAVRHRLLSTGHLQPALADACTFMIKQMLQRTKIMVHMQAHINIAALAKHSASQCDQYSAGAVLLLACAEAECKLVLDDRMACVAEAAGRPVLHRRCHLLQLLALHVEC